MTENTAIFVDNLVKRYQNGVEALSGLTLTVKEGEIFTLLGQNGAGKSTLINILTTYLRPTSGRALMCGKDIYQEASAVRSEIACVAQKTSIDTYLSLTENMMFQSHLYKIPKVEANAHMEELIAGFGLEQYRKYPVASYSGGVKRRLDIALNMMSKPKILFLDEPTVGMDIQSRQAMWNMMKKIRNDFGTTIFLTTHYLEEADSLSDTICIMKDGREVVQGTPKKLRGYLKQDMLKITFSDEDTAKTAFARLTETLAKEQMEVRENVIVLPASNKQEDLSRLARILLEHRIAFMGIEIVQPAIEDIFIRLTGKEG